LCRDAALQGVSCRILHYILHTTQRSSFCICQGDNWAIFYIFLVRFSSFKVCCLARVLLLDNMYMKILQMEPENQEKYGNGNNNEIERKLKDT
jgi:hypothetical protein